MDSIEFILVLFVLAIIVRWYVANEVSGAEGGDGLLAIADPQTARPETRYRVKSRTAPFRGHTPIRQTLADQPAYKRRDDKTTRRYSARDDNSRYRDRLRRSATQSLE